MALIPLLIILVILLTILFKPKEEPQKHSSGNEYLSVDEQIASFFKKEQE